MGAVTTLQRMVFANQANANAAVTAINNNLSIGGPNTTSLTWAYPQPYEGDPLGQWWIPFPGDPTHALAGVDPSTYFVSAGEQPIPAATMVSNLTVPLAFRDKLPAGVVEAITCSATKEMVQSNYTSAKLQVLMDTLDASSTLDLTTARVQGGVAFLIANGFVTADQATAALAPVGVLPQAQWS